MLVFIYKATLPNKLGTMTVHRTISIHVNNPTCSKSGAFGGEFQAAGREEQNRYLKCKTVIFNNKHEMCQNSAYIDF